MLNSIKSKLGELFNNSLINLEGTGKLSYNDKNYEINWLLNFSISNRLIILIESDIPLRLTDNQNYFLEYNLKGTTNDKQWHINTDNLIIYSMNFKISNENSKYRYECKAYDVIIEHFTNTQIYNSINVYINNFIFKGLELSKYDNEFKVDKMSFDFNNRKYTIKQIENYDKILELLNNNIIDNAATSIMSFDLNDSEKIDDTIEEVELLTWLLCLTSLNYNFFSMYKLYLNNEVKCIKIYGNTKHAKLINTVLIDNFKINAGIKNFIEKCYEKFKELYYDTFDIKMLISWLLEMEQQKTIELKIVLLIISLEYALSNFLLKNNIINQDQILKIHIVDKLRKANNILQFIPKELLDNFIKDKIRNPLFHQGAIPFITFEEKNKFIYQYFDLLIKIIYKILGYNGSFINKNNELINI